MKLTRIEKENMEYFAHLCPEDILEDEELLKLPEVAAELQEEELKLPEVAAAIPELEADSRRVLHTAGIAEGEGLRGPST